MSFQGACNGKLFAVHETATGFQIVGSTINTSGPLQHWGTKNTAISKIPIMRARKVGEQWGWSYTGLKRRFNPLIRVIRQADDTPLYVWEAETRVDSFDADLMVLMEEDDNGRSLVPPDGSAVSAIFPSMTDLASIETDVAAASLPSWITGTIWENVSNTTELLRRLFQQEQGDRGMKIHGTISDVFTEFYSFSEYQEYILLWMRCASRILYDHRGETCIPLILNKLKVDVNGAMILP